MMALIPFLAGCATPRAVESSQPAPALPSAEEVSRYVSSHWPDVSKTFARFSKRRGENAELIGISDVSCCYTYTTPECWYQVTGRFADEQIFRQRLFPQLERDDAGNLAEVIVMWHERRRCFRMPTGFNMLPICNSWHDALG